MQKQVLKSSCSSRLNQYRQSIKQLPILNQKSRELQLKYANLFKQKNRKGSQNFISNENTSECQSSRTFASEQLEDTHYYNAFLEKYQLLEKLGEGGNGCVYKCRYKPNNRFYAAKKFRIQKEHINELKKNFIHLKELNHKSICRYKALYFDQNERFAFLVMEYLPFPCLSDYKIKSERQLKVIVKQVINAVTYIHNRNLCHRDIKPENILYDQKNQKIKLIDFGISKKTYSRAARRDMLTIIGTPFYLAPEVYQGGGYDQRIDIWALGVTVYKLIAGYTPFESEYHSDTIANILNGKFQFDDRIWSNYSPFAQYFVSQLLKSQNQRISLKQASKHLWFQQQDSQPTNLNLKKIRSHNISLCQDFHRELRNNMKHATSKEQGELFSTQENQETTDENIRLNKTINTINLKQYVLQDSDDEDSVVTPKNRRTGVKFDQLMFSPLSAVEGKETRRTL